MDNSRRGNRNNRPDSDEISKIDNGAATIYSKIGIWPVKEHIQYITAMLYYGMMKKENRVATRILKMQERKMMKDSVPERLSKMLISIGKSIEDAKKEEK